MIRPALALLALTLPATAAEHHYAPGENLEQIDVAALSRATRLIDMAAYVLTDVAVIDTLAAAAGRGVRVRIYLDPGAMDLRGTVAAARERLAATTGVEQRVKPRGPYMHLKAYAVDGAVLRTGSANFSASGEKRQDNELSFDTDPAAVRQFEGMFERMWGR